MGNQIATNSLKEDLRTYLKAIDLMKGMSDDDYRVRFAKDYLGDQNSLELHRKRTVEFLEGSVANIISAMMGRG